MAQMQNRKLSRLKDYDYSQNGYYFVTICTKNREIFFGKIKNGKMILNEYGEMAEKCWLEIPDHFLNCFIDEFVIMPNHIHGILIIENNEIVGNNGIVGDNGIIGNRGIVVGNNDRCSLRRNRNMQLLPKIISQFKSSVTREIRKQFENFEFQWQKSFHDHIIRDEKSLNNIRQYIIDNPLRWDMDENNIKVGENDIGGNNDRCSLQKNNFKNITE
jgi:putative transposase